MMVGNLLNGVGEHMLDEKHLDPRLMKYCSQSTL
jgi:hypothetical protein